MEVGDATHAGLDHWRRRNQSPRPIHQRWCLFAEWAGPRKEISCFRGPRQGNGRLSPLQIEPSEGSSTTRLSCRKSSVSLEPSGVVLSLPLLFFFRPRSKHQLTIIKAIRDELREPALNVCCRIQADRAKGHGAKHHIPVGY